MKKKETAWRIARITLSILAVVGMILVSIYAKCRQTEYNSTPLYDEFKGFLGTTHVGPPKSLVTRAVFIDTRDTMQGYTADSSNLTRIFDNLLFPESVKPKNEYDNRLRAWGFNYGAAKEQILEYSNDDLRNWSYVSSKKDVLQTTTLMFDVLTKAQKQLGKEENRDLVLILTNEWVVYQESQYHYEQWQQLQTAWNSLRENRGVTLFVFLLRFRGLLPDQENGDGMRPLYLLLVGKKSAVFEETKGLIKTLENKALNGVDWNYISNVPSLQQTSSSYSFIPEKSQSARLADEALFRGGSPKSSELISYIQATMADESVVLHFDGNFPWKIRSNETRDKSFLFDGVSVDQEKNPIVYETKQKNNQPVVQKSAVWYDVMNHYIQVDGLSEPKISIGQRNMTLALNEELLGALGAGKKYILEVTIKPEVAEPEFWLSKYSTKKWYKNNGNQVGATYYLTELFKKEHFLPTTQQEEIVRMAITFVEEK